MKKTDDPRLISRWIAEFLCDYAPQFLTTSEHTLKGYKDTLTIYFQFLQENDITPSNLTRKHLEREWIEKWIVWLKENRKNSPDTCNNRLASLRRFLEFMAARDVRMEYLFQDAKKIKRQKCFKKEVSGMSRDAVAAMLKAPDTKTAIGRRDLVFLTLLYATAARLDEIRSLRIGYIHLDARKPYITIHGKRDKIRTAYLLPRAVSLLRAYIKEVHGTHPDSDRLLFYSRVGNGNRMLTEPALDKRIKLYAAEACKICTDVPPKAHAHQFRHAKASHWIEDGLSVVEIQFLLGHEQINTTMKYLDITTPDKVKALATLESEKDKTETKKWKKSDGSLMDFCGLKR